MKIQQKRFKFINEHEQRARDIVKGYHKRATKDTKTKKISIKQTKPFGDADKDGVFNIIDCQPYNKDEDGLIGDIGKALKTRAKETYEEVKETGLQKISGEKSRGERKEIREVEHESFHEESKTAAEERARKRARKKYGFIDDEDRKKSFWFGGDEHDFEKGGRRPTGRASKSPMFMSSPLSSSEPIATGKPVKKKTTAKKKKPKIKPYESRMPDVQAFCFGQKPKSSKK